MKSRNVPASRLVAAQQHRPRGLAAAGRAVRLAAVVVLLLGGCVLVSAQQPITGLETLAWQQDAPDLFMARRYHYFLVIDRNAPVELAGVTCTGTVSPFACRVPLPPLPPWQHSLAMTAADMVDGTLRASRPSAPVDVFVRVLPIRPPQPTANGR